MPPMRKKSDFPTKTCPVCGRPFAWRKKWRKDWENVLYCSEKCRRALKRKAKDAPHISPQKTESSRR